MTRREARSGGRHARGGVHRSSTQAIPVSDMEVESGERPVRQRMRAVDGSRRRTIAAAGVLVVLVLIVLVTGLGLWNALMGPARDADAGKPVTVEIPEGSGTATIAEILANAGVIQNATLFRLMARYEEVDDDLRPGTYDLTTGMSYEAVIVRLMKGVQAAYVEVMVPEGLTVKQIAKRFEEGAGIPAAEFVEIATTAAGEYTPLHPYLADVKNGTLEGYLFPKTYRVTEGSSARDVIEMMLAQFDTEMQDVDLAYASGKNLTVHDVVIIASMIEREAQLAEERPLVSSVIYNRLRKDMRLELCATVEYLLPENRPRLTLEDLKIDSPYNTYKHAGLPIGPIASPGLASIKAAARPADTDYLYYVLTGADGSHTFCETYAEFLVAKRKSRVVVP